MLRKSIVSQIGHNASPLYHGWPAGMDLNDLAAGRLTVSAANNDRPTGP